MTDHRPSNDPLYGAFPVEELRRVKTARIPLGQEVFSEDFRETPTDPDIDLTEFAEALDEFADEPTGRFQRKETR